MSLAQFLTQLSKHSGFTTVKASGYDTRILFLQRFTRLFAYGSTFLILVHFLSGLGISDDRIGLFMTFTMLGDVVISFLLTLITDNVGRRKVLCAGAILMIASGVVFSLSSSYWLLVLASVVGVISPSGNEIGPFRAVEESVLAQLTDKDDRSDIFVYYTMCGTAGAALGTISSGWLIQALQGIPGWNDTKAYRIVFALYAALGMVKLVLSLMLSRGVELNHKESIYQEVIELENEELLSDSSSDRRDSLAEQSPSEGNQHDKFPAPVPQPILPRPTLVGKFRSLLPRISSQSISILFRLILLFTIDSFASGLASPSWLTYFFTVYHGLAPSALGSLFFVTNILATVSNFAALPIDRRIGHIKTMAFTHFPSALFLTLVVWPPATKSGTWAAMAFLSLRACTQSMDQAPRQAFLSAVVLNEERTAVLGIVNIVKTLAQAGGIGIAGVLAEKKWWAVMIAGAGVMKMFYDIMIMWMFVGTVPRS